MAKKTCFVIQGFGKKQDYQTGRTLDLDASYEVIKEAVIDAGLECIRADEIKHSGTIDQPMFEQILAADLVIADLSTYNVNAAYELGVRHALRPLATIIVAETGFKYPFDFSHIAIRTYEHMGGDIGRREAKRFHDDLEQAIEAIVAAQKTDSPVYTFIPDLKNPMRRAAVAAAATVMEEAVRAASSPEETSLKELTDQAKAAIGRSDFVMARAMLLGLHQMVPNKSDITQMLALATYKSRKPTPDAALREARGYLEELDPAGSHNTETLGLWGAVHKRMWDLSSDPKDLDEAIRGYERGFQLKQDYYNGINLAFLLNVRARQSLKSAPAEAIADWVLASRVRRRVVEIGQAELKALPAVTDGMTSEEQAQLRNSKYWILATLQEAAVGLGDPTSEDWKRQAADTKPAKWMIDSTDEQIARLQTLLAEPPMKALGVA
jgi:Tetratricopeptide Repeats-Sensor